AMVDADRGARGVAPACVVIHGTSQHLNLSQGEVVRGNTQSPSASAAGVRAKEVVRSVYSTVAVSVPIELYQADQPVRISDATGCQRQYRALNDRVRFHR